VYSMTIRTPSSGHELTCKCKQSFLLKHSYPPFVLHVITTNKTKVWNTHCFENLQSYTVSGFCGSSLRQSHNIWRRLWFPSVVCLFGRYL
jgi:hypothetical protein